jgi:hypothetical protein
LCVESADTVDSSQWTVDSGQWTVDSKVDSGEWRVESGEWRWRVWCAQKKKRLEKVAPPIGDYTTEFHLNWYLCRLSKLSFVYLLASSITANT